MEDHIDIYSTYFAVPSVFPSDDKLMIPWSVVALQAPSLDITLIANELHTRKRIPAHKATCKLDIAWINLHYANVNTDRVEQTLSTTRCSLSSAAID